MKKKSRKQRIAEIYIENGMVCMTLKSNMTKKDWIILKTVYKEMILSNTEVDKKCLN